MLYSPLLTPPPLKRKTPVSINTRLLLSNLLANSTTPLPEERLRVPVLVKMGFVPNPSMKLRFSPKISKVPLLVQLLAPFASIFPANQRVSTVFKVASFKVFVVLLSKVKLPVTSPIPWKVPPCQFQLLSMDIVCSTSSIPAVNSKSSTAVEMKYASPSVIDNEGIVGD